MDRQRYLDLINPAITLVLKKGEDYNTNVQLAEYFPFGGISYVQMINLKTTRLRSILGQREPNFDSLEDTVLDLINYCIFYLDFMQGGGNEQL